MKIFLEIDTDSDSEEKCHNIITYLFQKNNPGQQKLSTENQSTNGDISIVVRDGDNKNTEDVKADLKRLGFTYYKFKKGSKAEDPRWVQRTSKTHWDELKEHNVLKDLNVWSSDQNGGDK